MSNLLKRVLSVVIVLVMVLGMLPLTTLAAEENTVVFEFGANSTATHVDGNDYGTSKSFTADGYTLALTSMSKVYGPAYDAKGNSCIKLGTSKVVGTFTFTVPEDVVSVVIAVAQYKSNTTKIDVNGTAYTISTASNNGAYTDITVDTSSTKTVVFKTVSGGVRAMVNSITYVLAAGGCEHTPAGEGTVTAPTCTDDGFTTYVCATCGEEYVESGEAALGHTYDEGEVTKTATCTTAGTVVKTCTVCDATKTETTPVTHTPVDGVCSSCSMVTSLETGVAYKWGMYQASKKAIYYFTGTMSNYYGATSTDVTKAVDMYLEEADGGYYITFTNASGAKKYINLVASGTYVNFKIEDTAKSVYTFDNVANTMVTNVNNTPYYIGTYSTYVTFGTSKTSFITGSNVGTVDVSQYPAHFYYYEPECEHEYFYACDPVCMICYEVTNPDAAHNVLHVEAKAATCTENGNVEYWYCEYCGTCWDNAEATGMPLNQMMVVVPAGHTYTDNCDTECDVCEEMRFDAPHNLTKHVDAVVPANCQEIGHPEYWECADCGGYFADENASSQLNPEWMYYTGDCVRPEGAADCATVACTVCGNDVYGYGAHEGFLACQGGTCSKCGVFVDGYGCENYDTPICQDGTCYYCGGFVAGLGHENGAWAPCLDGECSYGCGLKYPATEAHVDADADDYCDTCWTHLKHDVDPCYGGECSICWTYVEGAHKLVHEVESCYNVEHWYCEVCETVWADEALTQITNHKNVIKAVPSHNLTHVAESCYNTEHWFCDICEVYWADEALTQITNSKNVNKAVATHALVYVAESCYNTEHWYCEACEIFWADEALTQITNSKNVIKAEATHTLKHVEETCYTVEYWYCEACEIFWADEALTQITNSKNVYKAEPTHTFVNGACSDCGEKAPTITVYFQNNWLWTDVCAYYWGSTTHTNPSWHGIPAELVGNDGTYDIYVFELPADAAGLIFNGLKDDNSGNRDQTPDITGGWYDGICYQMAWDNGNKVVEIELPIHIHEMEATAESCYNVAFWYCAGCDCYFLDAEGKLNTNRMNVMKVPAEHAAEHVAESCYNTEYWYCEACDTYFADEALTQNTNRMNVIKAVPSHNLTHVAESCYNTEHWFCDICEVYWADEALTQITNAKNVIKAEATHDLKHVEAVAASCYAEGNVEYWYCEACETVWTDEALTQISNHKNVIIPATHNAEHVAESCYNVEYWFCAVCETYWADENLMQITNRLNVIKAEPTHAAEHTAESCYNEEFWYCAACDTYFADEALKQITNRMNVIKAEPTHTIVHVEETCTNVEYWYCSVCEIFWADEALKQITNSKNVIKAEPTHNFVDGTCSICGEKAPIKWVGTQVQANSNLDMQFALKASDFEGLTGNYIVLTRHYADGTTDVVTINQADWTVSGNFYIVAYSGIAAKEMGDVIEAVVYNAEGKAISEVRAESIETYALSMLGKVTNAEQKTMFVDLLNYGAEAQKFFHYNESSLVNSGLTEEQLALGTQNDVVVTDNRVKGENFYGTNLSLENVVLMQFAFKVAPVEGMYAEVTYTNYRGVAKTETLKVEDNNGYSMVSVNSLAFADYETMVTCTLYNADGTVAGSATDSMASYAARANNTLAKALMKFCASAYAYFM